LASTAASASNIYSFQDIVNSVAIAGYFGSGAMNPTPPPFTLTPNQGYTVTPPYTQGSVTAENFPGSAQTQVTGINNVGTTVGFYAFTNGVTTPNFFGFVDATSTGFTPIADPNTPTNVASTNQLLGVNDNNVAVGFYIDQNGDAQAYS
jgi:hypothetical protein